MATGLMEVIKRSTLSVIENSQLCDLRYGTVVSVNPLRVQITNQLTIPSSLLVVPEQLTNHRVSMYIDGEVKTVTIYNALQVDDKVALLRKQGGQSYFILDRI